VRVNRQAFAVAAVVLALTASAAAYLGTLESRQKLGKPAVRLTNEPIYYVEGGASTNPPVLLSSNHVYLPERVLDFRSQSAPISQATVATLPKDTMFAHRFYARSNGLMIDCQVVLTGADRSSIHNPQYCLKGSGFTMAEEPRTIRISRPHPYDLPVMKMNLKRPRPGGGVETAVFVYWFVSDGELTASHWDRMWWMTRDMLKTGVLQRWAYVMCYAPCAPDDEEATFERMKEFIAGAVPQFHLTVGPPVAEVARRAATR